MIDPVAYGNPIFEHSSQEKEVGEKRGIWWYFKSTTMEILIETYSLIFSNNSAMLFLNQEQSAHIGYMGEQLKIGTELNTRDLSWIA